MTPSKGYCEGYLKVGIDFDTDFFHKIVEICFTSSYNELYFKRRMILKFWKGITMHLKLCGIALTPSPYKPR